MPLSVHLGTADQATKPTGFAPPPEGSGIYKAKIKNPNTKTWDDGSKPPMMSLGFSCFETASGAKTQGWAEWFAFSIAPNQEEAFQKYRPNEQKWKFRNLVSEGLGQSGLLEKMDAGAKTQIDMDPNNWVDKEVFIEIRVYDDEYKGEKRQKASVVKFMSPEQVAEALGATDDTEDKSLAEAAASAAAATGEGEEISENPSV